MKKIFETGSPVDRTQGDKPKRPGRSAPTGSIDKLCAQIEPLLQTKKVLDNVYSNGYFENHYPDADKKLKNLLHDRAMLAWAHAEHYVPLEESEKTGDSHGKNISVVVNLGS